MWAALPVLAQHPSVHRDALSVAQRLTVASFGGKGSTSIVAMATDSAGNIYVTGTTSAPDFPVQNAAQPATGEARVLRTADLGATWSRVDVPADVTSVVPDPVDPQVVFALAGPVIHKSSDRGRTWQSVLNFGTPSSQTGSLAVDPGNHLRIAALGPDGVLERSTDGGVTWSRGAACPGDYCTGLLLADPTRSGTLVIQGFQSYVSRDWGITLQYMEMPGGLSPAAFDPFHQGWIYAGTALGVTGTLYLSTDFGKTWTPKGAPPGPFSAVSSLAADPNQSNTLLGVTADALYRSTDGGTSWVKANGSGAGPQVAPYGPLFFVGKGCEGLVARVSGSGSYSIGFSKDQGANWSAPALSQVTGAAPGAACAVYVTRSVTTDAFVAKLASDGTVIWATYLGGSDADAPIGIAVDAAGSVDVVGNTSSLDFPITGPGIGTTGVNAVFVTRLSGAGKVEFSRLIGGEARNVATGVALDALRNVWVTGFTNSQQFPVTPGVLAAQGDPNTSSGFLLELGADGDLRVATYLPGTTPGPMAVDGLGRPVVAGTGNVYPYNGVVRVERLDANAARVLDTADLAQPYTGTAPTGVALDKAGNVLLLGASSTSTSAPSTPRPAWSCNSALALYYSMGGDVFVTKLAAADWKPVYTLVLPASCRAQPGAMVLDSGGAPFITLTTEAGFPLAKPLQGAPECDSTSSVLAKVRADGSALEFATYLGGCGIPALAFGRDGVPIASTVGPPSRTSTSVLRVETPATSISLDSITNTFSGDPGGIVPGGLYTLAVSGFTPPAADFGLHPIDPLPVSLGGMEVRFGGIAAEIVQSGPGRVVVVAPRALGGRSGILHVQDTSVQISFNGVASNAVAMPVFDARPGVLSGEFLNPRWHSGPVDGYVLNEDGTVNNASNPAKVGSTITLFVTGLAASDVRLYPSWARSGYPGPTASPAAVSPVPGFLPSVLQVKVVVEADPGASGGRAFAGVRLQPALKSTIPPDSNVVAFYVQ